MIRPTRWLPTLIIPVLALSALFVAVPRAVQAAPAVTLSRQMAAPGDRIAATGHGFPAGGEVVVSAAFQVGGHAKYVQQVVHADNTGTFTATFTVPYDATPGFYTVQARDFAGHKLTATLHVLALVRLKVGSAPTSPTVVEGREFFVSGSGYSPNTKVTITATFPLYNGNSVTVNKTPTTGPHGYFFDVLVHVPFDAQQTKVTMTSVGAAANKQATADLNVVYRPVLSLNSTQGRPGGTISVSGSGFVPGVTVHVSMPVQNGSTTTTVTKDVTTNAQGAFTTDFALPGYLQGGTYTLTATGTQIGLTASARLAVTLKALLTLKPNPVSPGQSVQLIGSGYSANTTIHISVSVPLYGGGSRTLTKTVTTDAQGGFTISIFVPWHAAPGSISILAAGPHTSTRAALGIMHLATGISVSPSTMAPGSTVTIKGAGYAPNDKVDISVPVKMTDGATQTLSATVRADKNGQFALRLHIPGDVATGAYTVVARSEFTGRAPSAHLALTVSGRLQVSPNATQPGHTVTVTGSGFGANVNVSLSATFALYGGGTRTVSATVQTNNLGMLSAHITVPSNAAAGSVTVIAQGPNARVSGTLSIGHVLASVTASPASAIPGSTVQVNGSGYLANSKITVSITVTTLDGKTQTLTASATTNGNGQFATSLRIPGNAKGGTYTLTAKGLASGRAPTAKLIVANLATSIVAVPTSAVPGTKVTVNGFGYASGTTVTITLNGQNVGSATADAAGEFTTSITVPSSMASGTYTLQVSGAGGRSAAFKVAVNRTVATHFYFASLYTGNGYQENLAILNPTQIQARVTINYELTSGRTITKSATVAAHSRYTENVNADIGSHVSSSAALSADVPVVAERFVTHYTDAAIVSGTPSPAGSWYFANGNTSHSYREYIAIQNPSNNQIQVAVRFLPTHHSAFTIYRTMAPTSRTTVKVSSYVRDAVGIIVTSNSPVVANRTMYVHHGVNSKIGVNAPHRSWYFAGGPANPAAKNYIGAINPGGSWSRVTLRLYGPSGVLLKAVTQSLRPYARVAWQTNKLVGRTEVAAVITASGPVVAEQTTYVGRMHDASTDSFGVPAPAKTWGFAAASTWSGRGASDFLDLFNPNPVPVPIVVQYMNASAAVASRTYVVSPLAHMRVDAASAMPNAQFGMVAASNYPFVALNRVFINGHSGSDTSRGIQMGG